MDEVDRSRRPLLHLLGSHPIGGSDHTSTVLLAVRDPSYQTASSSQRLCWY